jgi:hypothetical protein
MMLNVNKSLDAYFLIAPTLLLVNVIIASVFYFKTSDKMNRWHLGLWVTILVHFIAPPKFFPVQLT